MARHKPCGSAAASVRNVLLGLLAVAAAQFPGDAAQAGRRRPANPPPEAIGHLTWASPQSNPIAVSPDGTRVAVANTTSHSVDLIDTATNVVVGSVEVGMEPVSLAYKPDGSELWVSNHVSDTISVIDTGLGLVVETVQDLDAQGATRFDEPVGIAFKGDGSQAYVALSSRNDVAIVDTSTYAVTGRAHITAQDPRALFVRNDRLYVAAFESGNQTELSVCGVGGGVDAQCSMWAINLNTFSSDLLAFAQSPNMPGESKNIVVDPDAPDRDLFVFDVSAGLADGATPDDVVTGVGTLLYGLTVSSGDQVYVTQTGARNAVNGNDAGSVGPSDVNGDGDVNLEDLENRMFLNQVAHLDCSGGSCALVQVHDLEEDPGDPVTTPLATPYGVAISEPGNLLVGTAASSSRVFTWDLGGGVGPGRVLDTYDADAIPRGVAFDPGTGRAYVLNTLGNTVTVLDVDQGAGPGRGDLGFVATVAVGSDPTPADVRAGRIAFNDAGASSSGTFSCASCHPDGNGDQLIWRIGGECSLGGCVPDEDEPRTTMPVRGLRDTVPLHWDGTLGDPFGGGNGSDPSAGAPPSQTEEGGLTCDVGAPFACFLHLVEGSLSGVMCDQGGCATGPSGQLGELDDAERSNMAVFLESVSYPPARSRRVNDQVSALSDPTPPQVGAIPVGALEGFEDFFFDQGTGSAGVSEPDTCADSSAGCHELPLGTANNSETLADFDAPTMRGMTDRFLHFSNGISNAEEFLIFANAGVNIPPSVFPPNGFVVSPIEAPIQYSAANGYEEITTFAAAFLLFQPFYNVRPLDLFQMFEEASTGHSGALGRQVTLNQATAAGCPACAAEDLLLELEAADEDGRVNLRGTVILESGTTRTIYWDQGAARYRLVPGAAGVSHGQLMANAQAGAWNATLTGHLRGGIAEDVPQPLIAPIAAQCGTGTGVSGDPAIPGGTTITIESSHVDADDVVLLNGQVTAATIALLGTPDVCDSQGGPAVDAPDEITQQQIQISNLPRTGGTDLLQILSSEGLQSNELPLP